MRKLGTIMVQQEVDQSAPLSSRQRVTHKLRDVSSSNPNNIILQPCPLYSTKSPTIINFNTNKQNFNNSRPSKDKLMDHSGFGMSLLLDGIHHTTGGRARLDSILASTDTSSTLAAFNNNPNVRQKDVCSNNNVKDAKKNSKKESLDSCRNISYSHQHQDGTFSSTTFKEQNPFSTVASEYQIEEKTAKKSSKLHKIKTRHPSKSIAIAMNLNDMIVGKKKTKIKRPLTSDNSECTSTAVDNGSFCTQKITTTKIFNSSKNSGQKEKENLPPIHQFMNCRVHEHEKEDHLHSHNCSIKNCTKCITMAQKLKAQVHVAKTLQRQNGCLENIVTQKRNLVEQLTRQVRTLVRENQQLSKSSPSKLSLEAMLNQDCVTTTLTNNSNVNVVESAVSNNNISLPQNSELPPENESCQVDFETQKYVKLVKEPSASSMTAHSKKTPKKSESTEKLEETEQRLSSLSLKYNSIQQNYNQVKQENQEINKFLNDLLYTLNARGYESVTDRDGNNIDLYRCKGETFLDLRGRDARLRTPNKRLAGAQETLLKALIGSQERIIQNLISQIEDHQKDNLLENRLSLESCTATESQRNALLEGEILTVLELLEGACHRNPEVYLTLKEQHADSQAKMQSPNSIVEAVLERCQKVINSHSNISTTSTLTKNCRRIRENVHNSRAATPPPHSRLSNIETMSRGMIYSENLTPLALTTSKISHRSPSTKQGCTKSDVDSTNITKALGLSPRGQIFPDFLMTRICPSNHLPQISRSSTQNPFVNAGGPGRHTNSPLIVANGLTPRSRLKQNSASSLVGSSSATLVPSILTDKNVPCLVNDHCPYCSRQFSSSTSSAEINAHMEMHFQG